MQTDKDNTKFLRQLSKIQRIKRKPKEGFYFKRKEIHNV